MQTALRLTLRTLSVTALTAAAAWTGAPAQASAQAVDEVLFEALEWDDIGPARGGRSTAIAGSDARPLEYYFGATGGGLWKTTDGGNTWRPVTDGQLGSASVGAVQVCAADPDVVYIGMGETQLRGNVQQGDGVYRSDDAGETWTHLGLAETQNISRIRIHPEDCETAWVAALGKHSVENEERGVFKTDDGGATWRKTLYRSPRTGAVDITLDPANPDLMYAALWEAWRKSWGMSSGGEEGGLFRSTDGGETWTEITNNEGLPQTLPIGKIGVALSPANPERVYALIEHEPDGGVYRSDDGGETWTRTNDDRKLRQRAFYYTRIYADPQDEDVVYALNTGLYRSTDGGETFDDRISVPHGDNHDLWIAPSDTERLANANDGGGNVSFNGGDTWTGQQYPTAQFYRVTTTEHEPYHVCGAQQDNSTACIPVKDWGHLAARGSGEYFYSVGGCESGHIAPHPLDTDIFYAGCYGGSLTRYDHETGLTRAVNVWPENPMGQSSEDLDERVQWNFPIVFSPHDPNIVYTGSQKVWKTDTEGQSWTAISGDLTRADPATMGPSGGPITKDQTGVETYATVFDITPSPHDPEVIWAGSDDGLVHITRNATAATPEWTDITPPDAPDFVRINTIEASPHTPGKAYVAGIRYLVEDDRAPYVWVTADYGETWEMRVDGIEYGHFVRAVREDPVRPGLLYAATEETVYVSWNDGASWQPLGLNLPNTQVSDLVVEDHDLVISTHGRSFWVMFDMDLLRELEPGMEEESVVLFQPRDVVQGFDNTVDVYYYLGEDAEEVTVDFVDEQGEIIRSFTATSEDDEEEEEEEGGGWFGGGGEPSLEAGSHRFRWNMRYPGYTDFEGRIFWAAGNAGPTALPGVYAVRLTVDGETESRDFRIEMNPRAVESGVTMADLEERFELAMAIRDRVSEANEAVIRIREMKEQIDARMEATDDGAIERTALEVKSGLGAVEGDIYQVRNRSGQDPLNFPIKINNKLAALMFVVEGSPTEPTDQSYDVFEHLNEQLDAELEELRVIIDTELARLNEMLRAEGLEPIATDNLITQ